MKKNVLLITHFYFPHIGGVERHVYDVAECIQKRGAAVTVLTETYNKNLKNAETINRVNIVRFSYPHLKLIGLIFIWWQILIKWKLIRDADVVHIHDVFIWYFPFRLFFPNKKVVTTIHGLEWDNPLSKSSIWQKRLASRLSSKTIGVGKFIEKYTGIKFDLLIYGATAILYSIAVKVKNTIVYVGRLEENTGLLKFLDWLKQNPKCKVDFCGDGPLRKQCEKYGTVHGFTDPTPFYKKAEYCVPGGYLAALEALSYNCKLKLFWNNKLKEDYWKMSPFWKLKGNKLRKWVRAQTWDKLADEYISLYHNV